MRTSNRFLLFLLVTIAVLKVYSTPVSRDEEAEAWVEAADIGTATPYDEDPSTISTDASTVASSSGPQSKTDAIMGLFNPLLVKLRTAISNDVVDILLDDDAVRSKIIERAKAENDQIMASIQNKRLMKRGIGGIIKAGSLAMDAASLGKNVWKGGKFVSKGIGKAGKFVRKGFGSGKAAKSAKTGAQAGAAASTVAAQGQNLGRLARLKNWVKNYRPTPIEVAGLGLSAGMAGHTLYSRKSEQKAQEETQALMEIKGLKSDVERKVEAIVEPAVGSPEASAGIKSLISELQTAAKEKDGICKSTDTFQSDLTDKMVTKLHTLISDAINTGLQSKFGKEVNTKQVTKSVKKQLENGAGYVAGELRKVVCG